MNKALIYLALVFSLVTLSGCGAKSLPTLPAAPSSGPSGTSSSGWGAQYAGAVKYCGEFYASYYSTGYSDYQDDLRSWNSFCDCYYSEVSKKVGYSEYFANLDKYDTQYQGQIDACESKVWYQYTGI